MQSVYYVVSFLCHRTCPHCYEDRFRPYYGEERERVVGESRESFRRIIDNFPERMSYREAGVERRGRVILAGGEVLLDPVRESVLYPALEQLHGKYLERGGVQLVVQTTGDVVSERILVELLDRHVNLVSVSGLDGFHAGLEAASARASLQRKLTALFEANGLTPSPAEQSQIAEDGRHYEFYGASPESWIGKLWPRGRAFENGLSTASLADNFCNAWSGGLHFLRHRDAGSEVSVDPNGSVYPCCMKTVLPIGSLREEKLESILDRLAGDPVYEAISMGQPQRMGLAHGWSVERFVEESRTTLPDGRTYENLCLGCDAFHRKVLAPRRREASNRLPPTG